MGHFSTAQQKEARDMILTNIVKACDNILEDMKSKGIKLETIEAEVHIVLAINPISRLIKI